MLQRDGALAAGFRHEAGCAQVHGVLDAADNGNRRLE